LITKERLKKGEIKCIARVKLLLNFGKLHIEPGQVVIFGPADKEAGVNVDNLIKNGSVVVYKSEKQRQAIEKEWLEVRKPGREKGKQEIYSEAMQRRGM